MTLEIQGKLVKILAPVTGEGKNGAWTKQEFIIETYDQYPKKVCCAAWGDKVETLRRFGLGDDLRVSINIESREYNERWFTEVRAWKLDAAAAPGAAPQQNFNAPQQQGYQQQGQPQYNNPAPQQYGNQPAPAAVPNFQTAESSDFFKNDKEDDLPF